MEKGWLKLEDRVVIVTGGASGIARHTVQTLVAAGAKAVIADVSVTTGEERDGAWCVKCDVTSAANVKALADAVVEKYGKPICGTMSWRTPTTASTGTTLWTRRSRNWWTAPLRKAPLSKAKPSSGS